MLNPIALIQTPDAHRIPPLDGLLAPFVAGPFALLTLDLADADAARYADIASQDAAWLSHGLARQHSTLAALHAALPIYPLQFGLIVPQADETLSAAHAHASELQAYFQAVTGATEWGIKAFSDASSEPAAEPTVGQSGLAWLKARQAAPALKREMSDSARLAAHRALAPLLALARANVAIERAQFVERHGKLELLNLALLIDDHQTAEFTHLAEQIREQLQAQGIGLSVSGPWPCFSFRPRL